MEAADFSFYHWLYFFLFGGNDGFPHESFEPFSKRRLVAMASLLLGSVP